MNEVWRQSQKRGDFVLVSVSIDDERSLPEMRRVLREGKPLFPVLHCDDLGSSGRASEPCGWHIRSVSREYWIDPQGVIITRTGLREPAPDATAPQMLLGELDFLKARWPGLPVIALGLDPQVHADRSVTLTVQLSNSAHTPLDVYVGGFWRWPRGSKRSIDVWPDEERPVRHVDFDDFGDYSISLEIPAVEGAQGIYCYAAVDYPGAAGLNNGAGLLMVADRETPFEKEQ